MGGNLSNMEHGHTSAKSLSSHILTFHSTAKWKAYFDASKETNKLMVIEFTAAWCGPCKYMDPIIQDFAAKYIKVDFIKIDVDELMSISQEFQVQAMPTFILMKKGKVVDKVVGAKKEELEKLIEKHQN
ncbi:putative monodehydroascorbate reductase (NADH) [Medicago truncatula]|uniref:Putative monodehydroascorbate reductase (NADH) n=1 Tax=Medicago truncatula TaxID=3880 RepID=D8L5E1_MEDTR|nr:thioredoxin H2 [Medicago truncatula]ACZ37070.1 thioredoxin h6 [Medicago truncatula]AES96506.1 thioredoxin [Medicago truncatula]AFK41942.1 unknown [Medicago truncatula]RHN55259.1 putative monodehydroascorbate reductase (NADH) [Medicago truncatula]